MAAWSRYTGFMNSAGGLVELDVRTQPVRRVAGVRAAHKLTDRVLAPTELPVLRTNDPSQSAFQRSAVSFPITGRAGREQDAAGLHDDAELRLSCPGPTGSVHAPSIGGTDRSPAGLNLSVAVAVAGARWGSAGSTASGARLGSSLVASSVTRGVLLSGLTPLSNSLSRLKRPVSKSRRLPSFHLYERVHRTAPG